jgi:hypothetical protein
VVGVQIVLVIVLEIGIPVVFNFHAPYRAGHSAITVVKSRLTHEKRSTGATLQYHMIGGQLTRLAARSLRGQ